MATYLLSAAPGQVIQLNVALSSASGERTDPENAPKINRIILPSFMLAANYPQDMIKLDTGLYYFKFTLPTGAAAVGTYLIDVEYVDPADTLTKTDLWQVVVSAPFGNYSVSAG